MITLTVDNSTCKLQGITPAQFKQLRELMSYSPDAHTARYIGAHRPTKRYLMDRYGQFPTGLLYLALEWLSAKKVAYTLDDKRKRPISQPGLFKATFEHVPYPEQKAAAIACWEAGRGIVVAPTGVGKSLICALIIQALEVRTLIVVPNLSLKRQLTESLRKIFGHHSTGGIKEARPIAVENVDALSVTHSVTSYDCVIIDEFHHSGAKTYRKLNQKAWNKIFYKFGLTATPFRSQDEERLLLESVLSQVIYRIEYAEAVAKGYIVPVQAFYYDLPKVPVKGDSWNAVYNELVINREDRNALIAHLLKTLHAANSPTLCLVKEIKHGEKLAKLTGAGFANGQSDDCQDLISWFVDGKLSTLIGTTGVLGEGVDTKPAEYVIIAGLGKSKNQFMQQVGRGVRRCGGKSTATIILFRDRSHKWSLAHFREQVKILKDEYGITPVKLELPDITIS